MPGIRYYSKLIYYICFITVLTSSCVSLKKNFIASQNESADIITYIKPVSNFERKNLNIKADSLIVIISGEKNKSRNLKAEELNNLYTCFARQLDYDRYYNSILQKEGLKPDTITPNQCLASIYLLNSAADYDKSYFQNIITRRTLNRGNIGNNIPKHTLKKSNNFLYSPGVRKSVAPCIDQKISFEFDSLYSALPRTNFLRAAFFWFYRGNDRFSSFVYDAAGAGSYAFGNTVGAFNKKIDQVKSAEKLNPYLKPYDILISKSPHNLTDRFIPGYFGHAALWFGDDITKAKYNLKDRIIKNPPLNIIRKSLVEAIRSGVRVSSLEEYADGEVYLIIRIRNLSDIQKSAMIKSARQQVSKPYDFNFDIESSEAVTCTELVFLACDFVDWKVRHILGRFTLSPDDLLMTALENEILEVPLLISEDKIIENPDEELLRSLLKLN